MGRLIVMQWLVATVVETVVETARTTTLRLDVPGWRGHRAGQHVDIRLTADDGYQAQRSFSIASPPGADRLELTVARIDDGEVSPYLTTVVDVGDQFELRGPIGGWFVWDGDDTTPALLIGGGSGVVPLMAMIRHHDRLGSRAAMRLVYSARTLGDVIYRDELTSLADCDLRRHVLTLTREASPTWKGRRGLVDNHLLDEFGWPPRITRIATSAARRRSSKRSALRSSRSATRLHTSRPNASDRQEDEMSQRPSTATPRRATSPRSSPSTRRRPSPSAWRAGTRTPSPRCTPISGRLASCCAAPPATPSRSVSFARRSEHGSTSAVSPCSRSTVPSPATGSPTLSGQPRGRGRERDVV